MVIINQSERKNTFEPSILTVLKRSFNLTIKVCVRFPWHCSLLLSNTIMLAIMPIIILWVSKILLDTASQYFTEGTASAPTKQILFWVTIVSVSIFIETILKTVNHNVSTRLSFFITFDMQENILRQCVNMDYEHYDLPENQNTIFRAYTESSIASEQLFSNFIQVINKLVTMFFSAIALCLFNPWLCLLAVMIAIPNLLFNIKLAVNNYRITQQRSERVRKIHYLSDLLILPYHVRDNLLFNTGDYFLKKWAVLQRKTYKEDITLTNVGDTIGSFIGLLSSVGLFVAYLTIILWSVASKSVGAVVMNVGLFRNAEGQIQGITTDVANLYKNVVFLSDYDRLMSVEPMIENNSGREELNGKIKSISFENVTFKYPDVDQYVLNNVSFEIQTNECVCICGPNGAGKSTILKLLLRLYDPQQGRILINGRDIRNYFTKSLRSAFGVLLQDFSRYALDIRENIAVGKLEKNLTYEELDESLEKARLKERVESFPCRSDTILGKIFGDGKTLSRGEWQKLGLARMYFRRAPVLVLDEPSSSLDPIAEKDILENFADITMTGISIIVTHRFSTIQFVDRILVVDNGQVVESGTHKELIMIKGLYEKMFRSQAEAYHVDILR